MNELLCRKLTWDDMKGPHQVLDYADDLYLIDNFIRAIERNSDVTSNAVRILA